VKHVAQATDLSGAGWRKSTRSGDNGGSCVEVAEITEAMAVRDSKDRHGPALLFTPASWTAFIDAVRADHFTA
jgi:hypothetical protein